MRTIVSEKETIKRILIPFRNYDRNKKKYSKILNVKFPNSLMNRRFFHGLLIYLVKNAITEYLLHIF